MNIVTKIIGIWHIRDETLVLKPEETIFGSSDNPRYTKEIGQKRAEEALKQMEFSSYRVTSISDSTLDLKLINPVHSNLSDFVYHCTKA